MSAEESTYLRFDIVWKGITIEVSYDANWLNMKGPHRSSHIELRVIDPPKAPIPVTETGYRSLFLPCETIENYGGPEKYVRDWIEGSSHSLEWRERKEESKQLSLF